ncbi:MAG: hypothetical protein IIW48_01505 [Clostridia bacterium]|nr:hypothetical protein [Clostridia bacterium]
MVNISIETINLNPTGVYYCEASHSAVNSVSIVINRTWKEVVKILITQAHLRATIPTNATVISDMLRASGFKKIRSSSLYDLLEANPNSSFVIKMHYSGYHALVPGNGGFVLKTANAALKDIRLYQIEAIWQFCPEAEKATGISRKSHARDIPDDFDKFIGKNINPENKFVGDCAIRALGGTLDCTWHDALDYLAKASNYTEPIVNLTSNIDLTLSELGLVRHKPIKLGGKLITGSEFCNLMSHTYFKGERIFAYITKPSHCVAVLPEKQADGTYLYKIQDIWDSTTKKIGDYWVFTPQKQPKPAAPQVSTLLVGEKIHHPTYGEGTILSINPCAATNIVEVDFISCGIKKITESWLKNKSGS